MSVKRENVISWLEHVCEGHRDNRTPSKDAEPDSNNPVLSAQTNSHRTLRGTSLKGYNVVKPSRTAKKGPCPWYLTLKRWARKASIRHVSRYFCGPVTRPARWPLRTNSKNTNKTTCLPTHSKTTRQQQQTTVLLLLLLLLPMMMQQDD